MRFVEVIQVGITFISFQESFIFLIFCLAIFHCFTHPLVQFSDLLLFIWQFEELVSVWDELLKGILETKGLVVFIIFEVDGSCIVSTEVSIQELLLTVAKSTTWFVDWLSSI